MGEEGGGTGKLPHQRPPPPPFIDRMAMWCGRAAGCVDSIARCEAFGRRRCVAKQMGGPRRVHAEARESVRRAARCRRRPHQEQLTKGFEVINEHTEAGRRSSTPVLAVSRAYALLASHSQRVARLDPDGGFCAPQCKHTAPRRDASWIWDISAEGWTYSFSPWGCPVRGYCGVRVGGLWSCGACAAFPNRRRRHLSIVGWGLADTLVETRVRPRQP